MSAETERYAKIADDHAAQLEGMLKSPSVRQSQYDRQTPLRIEYALKWVKRVANAIRDCDPNHVALTSVPDTFQHRAQELLRKLRPMINNGMAPSMAKNAILREIDELTTDRKPEPPDQAP